MGRETNIVVAVALIDGEGRILVQQRPQGKAMPGLWEFPGGKLESGETPEQALIRELVEELGIAVRAEDLSPACFASAPLEAGHMLLVLFTCRYWTGTPVALEASGLLWRDLAGLRTLPMPPADGPLIDLLEPIIAARLPIRSS